MRKAFISIGLLIVMTCMGCTLDRGRLKCCCDYGGKDTCWDMSPEKGETEFDVRERCRKWGGTPKQWEDGIVTGIIKALLNTKIERAK